MLKEQFGITGGDRWGVVDVWSNGLEMLLNFRHTDVTSCVIHYPSPIGSKGMHSVSEFSLALVYYINFLTTISYLLLLSKPWLFLKFEHNACRECCQHFYAQISATYFSCWLVSINPQKLQIFPVFPNESSCLNDSVFVMEHVLMVHSQIAKSCLSSLVSYSHLN